MRKNSNASVNLAKFALGLTLAATLAACGGGDSPEPMSVANKNTTAAVNATSMAALAPATAGATPTVATFANGFSGTDGTAGATPVALTGATTVAFTSSSATPAFAITNGGNTATGNTTFGSCIFTVTASTFPPESPLAMGKVVKVNPCSMTASTNGANANGIPAARDVVLVLGTTPSNPIKLNITVNTDGTVVIGSTSVGSVTMTQTTGAGS